jgi:hypothetical protein
MNSALANKIVEELILTRGHLMPELGHLQVCVKDLGGDRTMQRGIRHDPSVSRPSFLGRSPSGRSPFMFTAINTALSESQH